MSAYFDRHKDEYTDRLFGVSAKGDWDSWGESCPVGTSQQARDTIDRCDALFALKDNYPTRITDGTFAPRAFCPNCSDRPSGRSR